MAAIMAITTKSAKQLHAVDDETGQRKTLLNIAAGDADDAEDEADDGHEQCENGQHDAAGAQRLELAEAEIEGADRIHDAGNDGNHGDRGDERDHAHDERGHADTVAALQRGDRLDVDRLLVDGVYRGLRGAADSAGAEGWDSTGATGGSQGRRAAWAPRRSEQVRRSCRRTQRLPRRGRRSWHRMIS